MKLSQFLIGCAALFVLGALIIYPPAFKGAHQYQQQLMVKCQDALANHRQEYFCYPAPGQLGKTVQRWKLDHPLNTVYWHNQVVTWKKTKLSGVPKTVVADFMMSQPESLQGQYRIDFKLERQILTVKNGCVMKVTDAIIVDNLPADTQKFFLSLWNADVEADSIKLRFPQAPSS